MKLLQNSYLRKVVSKFLMKNAKIAYVLLGGHFKLSLEQCSYTILENEVYYMFHMLMLLGYYVYYNMY